jgi:hypothetical protein
MLNFIYLCQKLYNAASLVNTIDNVSNILWKHVVFMILNKSNDDIIFTKHSSNIVTNVIKHYKKIIGGILFF